MNKIQRESERLASKYRVVQQRYLKTIPMINQILRSKAPSEQLKYLIISNILVVTYLYRLYNGDVLGSSAEIGHKLI